MQQAQLSMPRLSPVVRVLIVASAIVFVLQLIFERAGISLPLILGFVPIRLGDFWLWQLFTYSFLHLGLMHLLFNALILWSIGSELEQLWGAKFFSIYYFSCVLGAALTYGFISFLGLGGTTISQPVVGASGGIYGLLAAYGILFGDRVLYFFMIFPMQARYFVLILGGIELVSSVFYTNQGIAHTAHLGGMLWGILFLAGLANWRKRSREALQNGLKENQARQKRLKKASHLRLVDQEDEEEGDPKRWH